MIPTRPAAPRRTRSTASGHALLALALAATLAACAPTAAVDAPPSASVDGMTIRFPSGSRQLDVLRSVAVEAAVDDVLSLPARLDWDATRTGRVRAPVAGQVTAIRIDVGDRVAAGDTLAFIDSPAFGELQAERRKSTIALQQAQRQLERNRELHDAGVVSARDFEDALAMRDAAASDDARMRASARLYGGSDTVDQRLPLRAPLDGIVVERRIGPGQSVGPDQDDGALFTISDPANLWLLVDVPEHLAGRVEAGLRVEVELPGGARLESRIDHVADFVAPDTRVVAARARIDNTSRTLKAGAYVRAAVHTTSSPGVDVPDSGVLLIDHERHVFVDEGDGVYSRRRVSGEDLGNRHVRVREGIEPGTRVVVAGALFLQQLVDTASTAAQVAAR